MSYHQTLMMEFTYGTRQERPVMTNSQALGLLVCLEGARRTFAAEHDRLSTWGGAYGATLALGWLP